MSDPADKHYKTVDLIIPDLLGIFRGKRIDADELPKVLDSGMTLPASVFALDVNGDTVESSGLGYDHGDADRLCLPVDGQLRSVPGSNKRAYMLMTMHEHDRSPFFADPRQVLANTLSMFVKDTGLQPVVAVELEFYLLDPVRVADDQLQTPIAPGTGRRDQATQVYSLDDIDNYAEFLDDVRASCAEQGIPASAAVAEYAPAQFEINLHHQSDVQQACDNALFLKRTIREVAKAHGFLATFMPKPFIESPGSGMHIHISLVDENGENIFTNETLLRHAVAGLLDSMRDATLVSAPTVNAYRRLQPFMYAPTAPCWGFDNRSTAIRIPSGEVASTRIEHRVAGADANPYLLLAVILGGIRNGLVSTLDAPDPVSGNAYEQFEYCWPISLDEAIKVFDQSGTVSSILGAKFCHVYSQCRQVDAALFRRALTRSEFDWYLGI
ncbi:MAG: glutamine synthetase family protein [Pseudomonadota bacterium]